MFPKLTKVRIILILLSVFGLYLSTIRMVLYGIKIMTVTLFLLCGTCLIFLRNQFNVHTHNHMSRAELVLTVEKLTFYQFAQEVVNSHSNPSVAINAKGIVIAWNEFMEKLTKVRACEIMGKQLLTDPIKQHHKSPRTTIVRSLNRFGLHCTSEPIVIELHSPNGELLGAISYLDIGATLKTSRAD